MCATWDFKDLLTRGIIIPFYQESFARALSVDVAESIFGSGLCDRIPNERAARDNRVSAIAEYEVSTRENAILYEWHDGTVTTVRLLLCCRSW